MEDKWKQYIAQFGGFLGALLLFFGTINVKFDWFNPESISAFQVVLMASVPFIIAGYGIWKNTYLTRKAKRQEALLKRSGLK